VSIASRLSSFDIEQEPFFQETVSPGFFVFGITGTIVYGILWTVVWPQPFESPTLRFILTIFLLISWRVRYNPNVPRKIRDFALYGLWFYCVSFFYFMYFANGTGNMVWAASLICITYMIFGALRLTTATIIFTLSAVASMLAAVFVFGKDAIRLSSSFESLLAVLAFALASAYHATSRRQILDRVKSSGAMTAIAVLAHEVRSPLFALRSGLSNIQSKMEVSDPGCVEYELLQRLIRRIDDVNGTLNLHLENLRFSNTTANVLPRQSVSTADVIRDAIETYGTIPPEIELDLDIDTSFVTGNQDGIRQVLINVIRNGIGAIRTVGGGKLYVKCKRHNQIMYFSVADTAGTLSIKEADNIFTPFSSFRSSSGIGVGLFASKLICEAMGSSISVHITPGVLTTFKFALPEIQKDTQ
jgi:two-component system CAI-1 autoinducer sensor kinase/phosphatase CqsS